MKKIILLVTLFCLVFSNTAFAYTLNKADTRIATNKVKVLNKRIQNGTPYSTIYKQQLNIQNKIKENRDSKNIKSVTYKNLDKKYSISKFILENLIDYNAVRQNITTNVPIQVEEEIVVNNQPCDYGWYYNGLAMSCQPSNLTRSCSITNGAGKQVWNGNSWNACTAITCNSGYSVSNGSCLEINSTQQTNTTNNQPTCSSDQHIENNTCVSNTKSCTVSNGAGQQTWNENSWNACTAITCNSGYSVSNGSCLEINSTQQTNTTNNQPTCSSDQHIENNTCVSNTKSCTVTNGAGQQTWSSNAWGSCILNEVIVSKYPGCDMDDIKLSNGQIWSACNVGSTIAGFSSTSYGDYYQYGEGICENGYHIPTRSEWLKAGYAICKDFTELECINVSSGYGVSPIVSKILKLPMAGGYIFHTLHLNTSNSLYKLYEGGFYWTSTPHKPSESGGSYRISGYFQWQIDNIKNKYPIRCIKD